ncbi:MAG: recombinase RecA, partial [Anaplasmataceae bacterium]|nr:recombinase RecA [Anaplasmataceae bacterium]
MDKINNKDTKDLALETALQQLDKLYGKGVIMKLSENYDEFAAGVISTGSLSLDMALGIDGIPKGRIIEIYGPESSGKTTLSLHIIAEAQKQGSKCVFIDAEHALDLGYAQKLGVKIQDLIVSQPDYGEQALDITDLLVRSNACGLLVIDSVAALTPKAEIDGDMGDQQVGLQARLLSRALRKLTAHVSKSNCSIIFINQIRMKIGVMFGSPETTTGGNALKFYSSVRLDIRKISTIKNKDTVIGSQTRVKIVKNKVAAPFKEAIFDILYGIGISRNAEIVEIGAKMNIVSKSGSYYSYGEHKLGQGKDNARNFLNANPKIAQEIESKIKDYRKNENKVITSWGGAA